MSVYGYIRVSSREQNEDRQIIAMREMQVPEGHLYIDKQSGKDFDRPAYKRMMRRVKKDELAKALMGMASAMTTMNCVARARMLSSVL